MSQVFVSYSRQSEPTARMLVGDLELLGHVVWFDQELSGGQSWWDAILERIRNCDVFVCLLDPNTLNSVACQREFGYAHELGKPVLPVLAAEGVSTNILPPELSVLQFIDYRKQDRNAAFLLARALSATPKPKPLPSPLPIPPEVPLSYLGGLARRVEATNLSFEEQSILVVEFRRSLRDREAAEDTRVLLARLRKRRDLLATIAEEVDDLLGSVRQTPPASKPTEKATPQKVAEKLSPRSNEAPKSIPLPTEVGSLHRLRTAILGALVGGVVGLLIVVLNTGDVSGSAIGSLIMGIAGAIAGAISGTDRSIMKFIVFGFLVGASLWVIFDHDEQWWFGRTMLFGGSLGSVLGPLTRRVLNAKRSTA
jgi:hypothetical protein